MFFYRLVIWRLMALLGLDEIYKERERRAILLGKKKKVFYKTKLLMDENMQTYTFMILGVVNMLFMLTLSLTVLEEPCEAFKTNNMPKFYAFTVTVKKYGVMIDRITIILFVALVVVGVKTVLDAIAVTKINMSPWLEQGKYDLPGPVCCNHVIRDPIKERAEAQARLDNYERMCKRMYKEYEESNGRCLDRKRTFVCDQNFNSRSSQSSEACNQTCDQIFDKGCDQTNDQNSDHNFDQTFDLCEQTLDQTCKQSHDQTSDQTYEKTYEPTYESASE